MVALYPRGMTDGERARFDAGRPDWEDDAWEDHCGDPNCEYCREDGSPGEMVEL